MSKGSLLILGKGGQLSNALCALLGDQARVIGPDEANFLDENFIGTLDSLIGTHSFKAVINTAAYTNVDLSETTGETDAFRINATAVAELAGWCRERKLPLVHFSSDYVFNGSGSNRWNERDQPEPLNSYGRSKLLGEVLASDHSGHYLIFRTSWLYDATGKNFFTTMRRLLGSKEELNVVADQMGAPTYVPHLAKAVMECVNKALAAPEFPDGTYHLCSGGETSWHGFASAIWAHERAHNPDLACKTLSPIPTTSYPLPAPRPLNSRLDCSRARDVFGVVMPTWEDGLKDCFAAADAN